MGKTRDTGFLNNCVFTDSSNNVGIGAAANASFKLQVTGATNLTGALTGAAATFSGNLLVGPTTSGFDSVSQIASSSTGNIISALTLQNTSLTETAGTGVNLNFGGRLNWLGRITTQFVGTTGGGDASMSFLTPSGGTLATRLHITSGGNVVIGGTTAQNNAASRGNLTINGTTSILNLSISDTNGGYLYHGGTDMLLVNAKNGAQLFYTNDTERMRITSDGAIGILGNTDVSNVGDKLSMGYFNSNYGWLQTWSSTPLYLNKLGNAVYAGSVRLDTLSDIRVKDNIQPIEGALNKVLSITGKKFHLKDEDENKLRYGFIAQELEGILDEFVIQTNTTFTKDELIVENVKSIENWASSWAALLVEAIKEQQSQIEELRQIVATK
jgi:hypothetical protein